MKIFKIAVIALIAASSFSSAADAQVIVKARIGSGHTYHRPVRRPVVRRRVYRRHRRVMRRGPVHHGPVRRDHRY